LKNELLAKPVKPTYMLRHQIFRFLSGSLHASIDRGRRAFPWLLIMLTIHSQAFAQEQLTLVTITNAWKYNQSGADLSGQFQEVDFSDVAWPSGKGLLGYEPSTPYPYPYPILTPLTTNNGRITFYFRTHFNFPTNPAGVTLTSTQYVDDGAVYYLNGAELGRLRITSAPVTSSLLASNATPEGQPAVLSFPTSSLVEGDNLLAVEVHQTTAGSSDIVFGMNLLATLPAPGPVTITSQPQSQTVNEGDIITFTTQVSGSPPYFFQWSKDGSPLANATNQTLVIPSVTTNAAGSYSFSVSNLFSATVSSNAVLTVIPAPYTVVVMTNIWKYNHGGINLGTAWRDVVYDDTNWPSGAALFYNESAALPVPKNTFLPLTNGAGQFIITYYFRTHFTWPSSPTGVVLTARTLIDDGAVIYLNGQEAARVGMPVFPAPISYGTFANRNVGDANSFQTVVLPGTNLVAGDNLLAVEVHQIGTNSSDVVFGLALGTNFPVSLPDLIIWGPTVNPLARNQTFANNACEVLEGCATPGTRRYLQFDTETRNIGTGDLFLGNPNGNPLFQFDSCHGHYHFNGFAEYRLLNTNGVPVAVGNKVGFCLLDLVRWDPNANASSIYDCGYQGIQRGWGDVYVSTLPCQWIDITGVPAGVYFLEMEIDPDNRIVELNETNNVTRVLVTIEDPCTGPPANNSFSGAQALTWRIASATGRTECATKESSEPNHAGNSGGASIWYRWTAPYSGNVVITTEGSNFDTLLGVYRGSAVNSLTLVAADDDAGTGSASLISTSVVAGTTYQIAVDGFNGASGRVVLNINPGANNPFANCLVISGPTGSLTGNNAGASKETGEPNHAGNAGGRSVWHCWTAPASGWYELDTLGSSFDTLLAVYTGGAVGSLTSLASDDNSGTNQASRLIVNAVAGTSCRIAVDGANGASGIFNLTWKPVPQPRFTSITRLSSNSFDLVLSGQAGRRYAIETSSHLDSWTPLTQVTNLTGTIQYRDNVASNVTQRFYRAVLVP